MEMRCSDSVRHTSSFGGGQHWHSSKSFLSSNLFWCFVVCVEWLGWACDRQQHGQLDEWTRDCILLGSWEGRWSVQFESLAGRWRSLTTRPPSSTLTINILLSLFLFLVLWFRVCVRVKIKEDWRIIDSSPSPEVNAEKENVFTYKIVLCVFVPFVWPFVLEQAKYVFVFLRDDVCDFFFFHEARDFFHLFV